jgi:prefoldin subunit 2
VQKRNDKLKTTIMATEVAQPNVGPPQAEVQEAIQKYRELVEEVQRLSSKIAEFEMERAEHKRVEETLQPLESGRRAYRMVGEVLVERTVGDVLPAVTSNRESVRPL